MRAISARKTKEQRRFAFIVYRTLLFFACTFLYYPFVSLIERRFDITAFSSLLFFISMFLSALVAKNSSSEAPLGKKSLDEWLWKQGKRNYTYLCIGSILFIIFLGFSTSAFGTNIFLAMLGPIGFMIYLVCVLLVLWKPKLFTSGLLGGIGSSASLFFVGFAPAYFALLAKANNNIVFWLLLLPLLLPSFGFLYTKKQKGLNTVQYSVLQVIHPEKLFIALRAQSQIISDQYQALIVKKRLDKELPLGIKTELIKHYVSENKSSTEGFWWLAGAIAFAVFVLDVVAQLILQDIFYAPYIKPFLCKILSCG